jgi:transposase
VIWLTIPQAAARVGRSPETIRRWIRLGRLTGLRNPIDHQVYVRETQLLDVERDARAAHLATLTVAQEAS